MVSLTSELDRKNILCMSPQLAISTGSRPAPHLILSVFMHL